MSGGVSALNDIWNRVAKPYDGAGKAKEFSHDACSVTNRSQLLLLGRYIYKIGRLFLR